MECNHCPCSETSLNIEARKICMAMTHFVPSLDDDGNDYGDCTKVMKVH